MIVVFVWRHNEVCDGLDRESVKYCGGLGRGYRSGGFGRGFERNRGVRGRVAKRWWREERWEMMTYVECTVTSCNVDSEYLLSIHLDGSLVRPYEQISTERLS